MIRKLFLYFFALFFIQSSVLAHEMSIGKHEHGKWTFKKVGNSACSIFQVPIEEKGDYTIRGSVLFYVFKEGNAEYVRIDSGYPHDPDKYVKVSIDNKNYQFFGEDNSAWSMKDDRIIIDAMKAGKSMTVIGYSKKGTETTDIYTLLGFTKAYNSLKQEC